MNGEKIFRFIKANNHHTPFDVDHFSIKQVGSKFYVYAHPFENGFNKKKIGSYSDYETAKNVVNSIIDLKLPTPTDI